MAPGRKSPKLRGPEYRRLPTAGSGCGRLSYSSIPAVSRYGGVLPIPGAGIDDDKRRVFGHDWEKEKLPTLEEIETTYRRANKNDDGSDL